MPPWAITHPRQCIPDQVAFRFCEPATNEHTDARRTSRASRAHIAHALYRLRALTQDTELLGAAETAIDATYSVRAKGKDLLTITAQDLAARRQRAIDADNTLLAASVMRLTP